MAKKSYTEDSVIRAFKRFRDVDINTNSKTIYVVDNSTELGNGSRGKLDYLTKYCGYTTIIVAKLIKRSKVVATKKEREDSPYRPSKRDKINLAGMVKNTMNRHKL